MQKDAAALNEDMFPGGGHKKCVWHASAYVCRFFTGKKFYSIFSSSSNTKVKPKSCNFHDSIFKCEELSHIKEGAFRRRRSFLKSVGGGDNITLGRVSPSFVLLFESHPRGKRLDAYQSMLISITL